MSPVLGLVCIFALVALATPCCLPNQASFDLKLDMNVSYSRGGVNGQYSNTVNGSAAFDFKKQLFFLELYDGHRYSQKMVLNLGTQQRGAAELTFEVSMRADSSGAGANKFCSGARLTGSIGKPWQCIFENQNILTKIDAYDGEAEYLLLIPEIIWGPITMQKDVCFPRSGYVEAPGMPGGQEIKSLVYFEISNFIEKVDASVFDAPCKLEPGSYMGSASPPFPIPTPDELVEMIRAQMRPTPTDGPATPESEIESEIQNQVEEENNDDQESHSSEGASSEAASSEAASSEAASSEAASSEGASSEGASSEAASSEGASSEAASSETRRRRCIIPGAFGGCY